MRRPLRTAPPPPLSRDDGPFDPFDPLSRPQRKKPPPRPPPPNPRPPPVRPAHFVRRPTVLSAVMSKRPEPPPSTPTPSERPLIDWSSPPRSPTGTARSSSDGLSVDSFGSDGASSASLGPGHSQAESGFEDDFDPFSSRKASPTTDPFSPPRTVRAPAAARDPDFLDPLCNGKSIVAKVKTHNVPTIIRGKPSRPQAPKDSALLTLANLGNPKNTPSTDSYGQNNQFGRPFETKEDSPPMPSMPPPPPPALDVEDGPTSNVPLYQWDLEHDPNNIEENCSEEPYAIAVYDFPGTQDDDLPFVTNDKIRLIRQMNDEWLYGKLRSGMEGMFPANYVDIKIPLPLNDSSSSSSSPDHTATALFDFEPQEPGDVRLTAGCKVRILSKLNEEWLYGEVYGVRGQFPANYIDKIPNLS